MKTWKRTSGEPITAQQFVAVYCEETGEQGEASVRWTRFHSPEIYGAVCKVDRVFDESGAEIAEPKRTVLDANPIFA